MTAPTEGVSVLLTVQLSRHDLIEAVIDFGNLADEEFRADEWTENDAEWLERLVKRIRGATALK